MRTDSVTLETCAAWATLLLAAAGGKLEFPMHASVSECACAGDTNCGAEHTGQLWQVLSTARRRSKIPFSKHRSRRQPSVQREPVRVKGDMPSESSQQSWSWEAGADVEELLISELVAAPHGESLDMAMNKPHRYQNVLLLMLLQSSQKPPADHKRDMKIVRQTFCPKHHMALARHLKPGLPNPEVQKPES